MEIAESVNVIFFYHPEVVTPTITQQARRQLGHCYCGSLRKRVINYRALRSRDSDDFFPPFFVVCSRTGRSMKLCM